MKRCLDLAQNGIGRVSPNPMVGAVLVYQGRIISEGFHTAFGKPHAEVEALKEIHDTDLLSNSTLYVNLEPCCHYGKTPPCTGLILEKGIKNVVVGCEDPYPSVAGNGIRILKNAGVNVISGVLEKSCMALNARFFTRIRDKRPYVILKWAQTLNGYLTPKDQKNYSLPEDRKISGPYADILVHKWRSEEDAVLIGSGTALKDNPRLNVRHWKGRNPRKIILEGSTQLGNDLLLFEDGETLVFSWHSRENQGFMRVDPDKPYLEQVLNQLYELGIQSVLVEGGKKTISNFLEEKRWDEIRLIRSKTISGKGTEAPLFHGTLKKTMDLFGDNVEFYIPES